ncbi:MAG: hypothetical protein ACRDS9_14585 [Pseudonocardiaceae bacterium]
MIGLDPLENLAIILAAFGIIPLLLTLGWVARRARDSYTVALLRSRIAATAPSPPYLDSGKVGTSLQCPRPCRPPRPARPVTWFVASLRDEDTHLGAEVVNDTVTARCGRSFRPLTRLRGSPPDPPQTCPTCALAQPGNPSSRC